MSVGFERLNPDVAGGAFADADYTSSEEARIASLTSQANLEATARKVVLSLKPTLAPFEQPDQTQPNHALPSQRYWLKTGDLSELDYEEDIDGDDWRHKADCRQTDSEAFFPEKGGSQFVKVAKKICMSCTVRSDCLMYALDNNERFGIWGGMTERERRKLKKSVR